MTTTKRKKRVDRYSRVTRRMWTSEDFRNLTQPEPCGGWLWFRFLTGPELSNIPGLFRARASGLAEDLGWTLKGFQEAFREVEAQGLAEANWAVGLVWLPKAIVHNEPESPNVVLSWGTVWAELPDCDLKAKAYSALESWARDRGKAWVEAFRKACPKPSGKPSRKASVRPSGNQEQDQDQRSDLLSQPAKDLTGLPARDPLERAGSEAEEERDEAPRSAAPTNEFHVARGRLNGERPRVVAVLPARVSPRELEVPQDFEHYATELGVPSQTFRDIVTDWREKTGPGTHTRLFDVLCRFIEMKAYRRERSAAPPQSGEVSREPVVPWSPPPSVPPDPNGPPPNPLRAVRASNG